MKSLSLWHLQNNTSQWLEDDLVTSSNTISSNSASHEDDVELRALYSLISTGSERLVCSGNVPNELFEHMSVPYMKGDFTLPIKYGYSLVGKTKSNSLVHLLHPHQQTMTVSKDSLFELPDDVPARRLTLLSNMETIINAIWDSEQVLIKHIQNDLPIAICGFGNIGALLAITLRLKGANNIQIIEQNEWRINKANELGFQTYTAEQCSQTFSLFYDTSSVQQGLQWCINHAQVEAHIIELSWYGNRAIELNLGMSFHYNRVKLIASQVSRIPLHKPNETYLSRKQLACNWLHHDIYDQLFADNIAMQDVPDFFDSLRSGKLPDGLIWCIEYP